MSYSTPGDIICGNDCYSEIQVNSTYWEVRVEHAGEDVPVIFKKQTRSRTLWINLDKINEVVTTDPYVHIELMVPTISKYATFKHPEYGYLRPVKDGDGLIERKNQYRPNGDKFYIHGTKEATQTVKWGMNIDDLFLEHVNLDPIWFGKETGFEYDATTETTCDESGRCTKTLYSGYSPSYFENVIRPSPDWLEYYKIVYLEKDKDFDIKVISFNETNFEFKLETTNETFEKENVPFKYCTEDRCWLETHVLNSESRDFKRGIRPTDYKNFTFGFDSTTIQLQDADSENLEDSYGSEINPSTNYGSSTTVNTAYYCYFWDVYTYHSRIKFNMSAIPAGSTIEAADLCIYAGTDLTGAYNKKIKECSNQTWTENTITYNDLPSVGGDIVAWDFTGNSWNCNNVTNWVITEFGDSEANVSFGIEEYHPASCSDFDTSRPDIYSSKEHATTANRPYLNITYTAAVGDTCDCSSIQGETAIDCSENCDIEACDVAGVDIQFTGAGTITVAGDITNIGDTTFSTGCTVELCNGCQWG